MGADARSDASSPLIDAGGGGERERQRERERERGNGRLEIETLNAEPAIIHGYGYNNVCTVLCPKACPCACMRGFFPCTRPSFTRAHEEKAGQASLSIHKSH